MPDIFSDPGQTTAPATWTEQITTDPGQTTTPAKWTEPITSDPGQTTTPAKWTEPISTDPGQTTAPATWTAPTTADKSSVYTRTSSHNSGSTFDTGITTVTYTPGNIPTYSLNISVKGKNYCANCFLSSFILVLKKNN